MKAAFEADCKALWEKMCEVIPELNGKQEELTIVTSVSSSSSNKSIPTSRAVYRALPTLPLAVSKGGTGATTASEARENLGIYVGSTPPEEIKDSLPTGAIYIYFEE